MSEEKAKAEMKPALSKMKKFYGLGTDGELTLLPLPSLLVRSEEHTSELQSRPHISYAVFCLKKKKQQTNKKTKKQKKKTNLT